MYYGDTNERQGSKLRTHGKEHKIQVHVVLLELTHVVTHIAAMKQ